MRQAVLAIWLASITLAGAAQAQVEFPPGSALGIIPPPGFVPSLGFTGFERRADGASLVLVEAPPEACEQMRTAMAAKDRLAVQGIEVQEVRPFPLRSGRREAQLTAGVHRTPNGSYAKWVMVACDDAATALVTGQVFGYPPDSGVADEIEGALATLATRTLSLDDRRGALGFTFTETDGMVLREVIAGSAAALTPPNAPRAPATPVLVIGTSLGATPAPADEEAVARQMVRPHGAYSDVEVLSLTRVPFAGKADAIRVEARAVDRRVGRPVRMLQFVTFRSDGGYVRLLATALDTEFAGLLPEFERIAASVTLR